MKRKRKKILIWSVMSSESGANRQRTTEINPRQHPVKIFIVIITFIGVSLVISIRTAYICLNSQPCSPISLSAIRVFKRSDQPMRGHHATIIVVSFLLLTKAAAAGDDGAETNAGDFSGGHSKLSGIIIPGFASTQLRAWSILDCPYSPLDFNPLDLVWLDTTKVCDHFVFYFIFNFWLCESQFEFLSRRSIVPYSFPLWIWCYVNKNVGMIGHMEQNYACFDGMDVHMCLLRRLVYFTFSLDFVYFEQAH